MFTNSIHNHPQHSKEENGVVGACIPPRHASFYARDTNDQQKSAQFFPISIIQQCFTCDMHPRRRHLSTSNIIIFTSISRQRPSVIGIYRHISIPCRLFQSSWRRMDMAQLIQSNVVNTSPGSKDITKPGTGFFYLLNSFPSSKDITKPGLGFFSVVFLCGGMQMLTMIP